MSWATRCPSCATVFRVAEDQLRVSEGFVRCGRCDAVFDARAQLFDLETGAPLRASPPPAPAVALPPAPLSPPPEEPALGPETSGFASTFAATEAPPGEPELVPPGEEPDHFAWQSADPGRREPDFSPAGHEAPETPAAPSAWAASDPEPSVALDAAQAAERMRSLLGAGVPAAATDAPADPLSTSSATPFASLERRATPRPWLRTLGWLGTALLSLGLPLQWAWIERENLRAQWPMVESLWQQACGGCEPVMLTRLDGLVVASSSLQPTPQGQAYQLRLRIENRAGHALRLPWVDLQLADTEGRRLLRRSLSPTELGQSGQRVEPGASLELQATFRLDGRLAGYEVGLFHP